MSLNWDIEERAEDAMAAWLQKALMGEMLAYTSEPTARTYPCAIVYCSQSQPVATGQGWYNSRRLLLTVSVQTEAAPLVEGGVTVRTARQRNALARGIVLGQLIAGAFHVRAAADGDNELNHIAHDQCGVVFAMMQPRGIAISVDGEPRRMISDIAVEVIAQPAA